MLPPSKQTSTTLVTQCAALLLEGQRFTLGLEVELGTTKLQPGFRQAN